MKLIVSTGAFPGFSVESSMSLARDAGADGVELMLTPRSSHVDPEYVCRLEDHYEVPVRSVHTILRLRSASPELLARDIIDSARFASRFPRCKALVVHTPQVQSLHDPDARVWFDAVNTAVDISQRGRFEIAIENSGRGTSKTPTWAFDHPHRLLWLTEEWDLKITYDTAHAASRNWDLLESLKSFLPRIANIHLSDVAERQSRFGLWNAMLRDHQLPGHGMLPLDDLLLKLAQTQYDGLVTLELSPVAVQAWWRPSSLKRITEAVERCRVSMRQLHPPQGHTQERA
ncbi:MAG: sugar phosphate isomerase/epimerase [Nitrolancea sp.]